MIKFGPSGNSISFFEEGFQTSTESAIWTKNRGLDCFEYSFGRGVNLSEATAIKIGEAFANAGVELSVHAPYFINFANPDDEMAEKSYNYVLSSAIAARRMQAKRIVFHPASQGKMARDEAVDLTLKRLDILRDMIYDRGYNDLIFCPETMGKLGQIGTVEEIVRFCKLDDIYVPCVDFGHINAREKGSLKTVADYKDRLSFMIDELGFEKMQKLHIHFSKIEYTKKGEVKHLTFEDTVFGPEFEPLAVALKELSLQPFIVSESAGTQAEDALYMKKCYFNLK
ncbi:MAG: TIM barrel protein [Clostridia bacterium]|nr:TIM barrel protein [Clostridia bacterium]